MNEQTKIAATAEDLVAPVTVPADAYISKDYAAAEQDRLWRKTWLQAGRLEDIPEIGNFFTYDIGPDGIISLIDGRKFKSMKRHLSLQGFTPESYREHFSLPKDFPMVSPEYAARRSALARSMGLGLGGRQPKADVAAKPARKPKTPKS